MPTLLIFDSDRSFELLLIAQAVVLTAYGLTLMFFGYRLYRLLAVIAGGLLGCLVSMELCIRYVPYYPLLYYFLGIAGGAIVGALFYYVSIFLLGAMLGASVVHLLGWAWLVSRGMENSPEAFQGMAVSYIVAGLTAGILALVFRRPFLILITSLGGASATVQAAAVAGGGMPTVKNMTLFHWILTGTAFVVLSLVGILVQRKATGELELFLSDPATGAKPKKQPADAS